MTSSAIAIREAIVARLTGLPWLPVKTIRRQPRPQVQEAQLPALLVCIADEAETPWGDANVGQPCFVNETTIGISLLIGGSLPDGLDADLDVVTDQIRTALLTDPSFVRGIDRTKAVDDPDRYPLFEAVTKVRRGRLYPQEGATYFAEGRMELTFQFITNYEPVIPDPLAQITFTGRPAPAGAQTPPVRGKVTLPQ